MYSENTKNTSNILLFVTENTDENTHFFQYFYKASLYG